MRYINLHLLAQLDNERTITSILTVEDERGRQISKVRGISQDMHYERLIEGVQNGLRKGLDQLLNSNKQGEMK